MIQAALFDMDGVLIDSVEIGYQARATILREYGVDITEVPDPHNEAHKGATARQLLAAVKAHHGVAIDEQEFLQKAIVHMRHELLQTHVTADPQLLALLTALKDAGVSLAIVSSGKRVHVDMKLGLLDIGHFFDVIISAEDVATHKPSPVPYVTAMERLSVSPSGSVVFEDSLAGVRSGTAAGATVVGVSKYSAHKQPIPGADLMIDSWGDISLERLAALVASPLN